MDESAFMKAILPLYRLTSSYIGEGNGNPLQYSCLENPMDGGVWQATVHRVTKSRTWLSDFTQVIYFFLKTPLLWEVIGTNTPNDDIYVSFTFWVFWRLYVWLQALHLVLLLQTRNLPNGSLHVMIRHVKISVYTKSLFLSYVCDNYWFPSLVLSCWEHFRYCIQQLLFGYTFSWQKAAPSSTVNMVLTWVFHISPLILLNNQPADWKKKSV